MKKSRIVCIVLAASGLLIVPAMAWLARGHYRIGPQAVATLPDDLPAFFRSGAPAIAHYSLDPDVFTRPIAPAELHDAESPEHYFDIELLAGEKPPPARYAFIELCARKGLKPQKVGLLPYAIVEWTQRLTAVFAEYRKWPDNPYIQQKALVYAGILSHYAADLCQPLHTTIHYDGRARDDGSSPRSGIHLKADALIGKLAQAPTPPASRAAVPAQAAEVKAFDALLPAVLEELGRSHALVDKVYELEKDLPAENEPLKADSPSAQFARGRLEAASTFIARLYETAWKNSEKIELPSWHVREQATSPAAPPP